MRRIPFLIAWVLCAAPYLMAAEKADTVKYVAMVNGERISVKMIERELVRIHTFGAVESSRVDFSLDKLVQRLINDRLLEQEARNIGLDQDSAIVDRVNKYRDARAYEAFSKAVLPDTFQVSEDEVRAEYDRLFQRVEIRTLCVVDSALSVRLADSIRHGASWAELAKTFSVDKFKKDGGLAGILPIANVPVMREEVLQSKPGDVVGPSYQWGTWVLIGIEKRMEPDTATKLDSVRAGLERLVTDTKRKAARKEYVERLKAKFPVTLDTAAIDSLPIRLRQNLPVSNRPLVTVGGKYTVSETEMRGKYMHRISSDPTRETARVVRELVEEQTQTLLMQAEAAQSDYRNLESVTEPTKAYEDSILVIAYLQDAVATNVKVTETEIAAFYEQNKSMYRERSRYKVLTLTRLSEQEAQADYDKLQAGTDFAWLAKTHSTDDARDKGGERDWLTADKLPEEVGGALDTMKIGSITPPVRTTEGLVIIKLVDRQAGAQLTLDKVRGNAEENVLRHKQMDAIDATIKKLREGADIRIQESVINELRVVGKKS